MHADKWIDEFFKQVNVKNGDKSVNMSANGLRIALRGAFNAGRDQAIQNLTEELTPQGPTIWRATGL